MKVWKSIAEFQRSTLAYKNDEQTIWKIILGVLTIFEIMLMISYSSQHDELEPNLKKILHRNGIWGLEAIVM